MDIKTSSQSSLLDKFKTGTPQVAQSADAKPAIKNEQKTDEVVISKKEEKPKKTTAHYAGVGAGIGALTGIVIPVIGLTVVLPLVAKFKKNIPFKKFFQDEIFNNWRVGLLITGLSETICTETGLGIGALTGLIKNRKKDK